VVSGERYHRFAMLILAADTSTSYYSLAICDSERVVAELNVNAGRRHAERLIDAVDWLLKEAQLSLADMELLAVGHGPGSFTGLRVGVSSWKGLALGAGLPLVGVSSLDAMARSCAGQDVCLCPLLDARMAEVYGAVYECRGGERRKVRDEVVCSVEELLAGLPPETVFFGEGAEVYRDQIVATIPDARFADAAFRFPRAWGVALEARDRLADGAVNDPGQVRPVYLRKSQAEEARLAAANEATTA